MQGLLGGYSASEVARADELQVLAVLVKQAEELRRVEPPPAQRLRPRQHHDEQRVRARLHEAAHGREERHGGHEARERGGHEAEEPARKALEEALLEVASAGERPDLKISFDTTEKEASKALATKLENHYCFFQVQYCFAGTTSWVHNESTFGY